MAGDRHRHFILAFMQRAVWQRHFVVQFTVRTFHHHAVVINLVNMNEYRVAGLRIAGNNATNEGRHTAFVRVDRIIARHCTNSVNRLSVVINMNAVLSGHCHYVAYSVMRRDVGDNFNVTIQLLMVITEC